MANVHGSKSVVKLTATDISAYVDSCKFPLSGASAETTTFGAAAKTYIPGIPDAKVSLSGKWDATLDALIQPLVNAAASAIEYDPAGTGVGTPKYTASGIVTKYEVDSEINGAIKWSAEIQISGAVTRGTN